MPRHFFSESFVVLPWARTTEDSDAGKTEAPEEFCNESAAAQTRHLGQNLLFINRIFGLMWCLQLLMERESVSNLFPSVGQNLVLFYLRIHQNFFSERVVSHCSGLLREVTQCLTVLSERKFLLMSSLSLSWDSLRLFPLILSLFPGAEPCSSCQWVPSLPGQGWVITSSC